VPFYYPHAIADGNQRIPIRNTLEFSTTVLSTLSPYLKYSFSVCNNFIPYFVTCY